MPQVESGQGIAGMLDPGLQLVSILVYSDMIQVDGEGPRTGMEVPGAFRERWKGRRCLCLCLCIPIHITSRDGQSRR